MDAPEGVVTLRKEENKKPRGHKEAWSVNEEHVVRWHNETLSADFEPEEKMPGYWRSVVFVLTEHLASMMGITSQLKRGRKRRRPNAV